MSNAALKPIVMIGGGGHASVLVDILRQQQREIVAVVCPDDLCDRAVFTGIRYFSHDDDVFQFSPNEVLLVNGVGVLPNSGLKRKLNQYYLSHGYQFETVVADTAQVSPYAKVSAGAQIFAGVIVQAGARVGSHSIINTGAIVEHDCEIGPYNHVAPRATLCGQVKSNESVYVGAGAIIIQNITLAQNVVVGAGAIVTRNLRVNDVCYPSRATIKREK